MKHILIALLFIPFFLQGQDATQQLDWQTDILKAKEISEQEGKAILMVFSGSDWCKPCIQLRTSVWESNEFKAYAEDKLVLLELDFPASKKNKLSKEQTAHNESLAEKYNPEGTFPAVVLIDPSGKEISRFGYNKEWSPEDYVKHIDTQFSTLYH